MDEDSKLEESLLPHNADSYRNMYPDVSETFDCRICGGGQIDKDDPLLSPCECSGGLSLVHAKCLMKWIEMRPSQDSDQLMTCEICKNPYRVELRYKFKCTPEKVCRCKPIGYLLEAFMLIVCLSCTVIMMIIVSPSLYSTDQSSNVMVWSLFGVTVVMAFIAFKKIIRRFVVAASYTEIVSTDPPLRAGSGSGGPRNPLAQRESSLQNVREDGGGGDGSEIEDGDSPSIV
mmetsp:Transcript_31377/g.62205  ORF Transcript_31377/g.62205 Transcript_31377/m.62205 type:complete len:231 (-) Transcript_31377:877-1569(-)